MRRLLLLSVVLTSCFASGLNFRTQTGIVVARPGEVCLQIENSTIRAGAKVDLVVVDVIAMDGRQSVVRAEVVRQRAKPCSGMDRGNSYTLRRLDGASGTSIVAIAIIGFSGPFEVRGGIVAADLDGDGGKEFFRACASHEGIHFTVWSGKPLKGRLRFHAYHYAGYDLEPNCSGEEWSDPPG